jgi:translation initiation factor IF-3
VKWKKEKLPLINEAIKAEQVQVIASTGENVGIVSTDKALRMAENDDLDLVMITQKGKEGVPVCKVMDFGKVLYERKKKQVEAKKHQKVIQVKEIKMRPKIGDHDYQTKIKHAVQFLSEGKHVKIALFFRGRENVSKLERGSELFERIDKDLELHGLKNIVQEKESKLGQSWSRIYYLKNTKS